MKAASVLLSLPTLVSDQRSVLNLHGVKAAKQGDDIFSTETFVTRFNRHQITILSTGKENTQKIRLARGGMHIYIYDCIYIYL